MPGFDGNGPDGAGAMTGGGRGLCNSSNVNRGAQYATGFRRGLGFGRRTMHSGQGMRRGFGGRGSGLNQPAFPGYYATDAGDEMEILKNQADDTKNALDALNKRIAELEKKSE